MKNIAYAKIGKSILFDMNRWGSFGGDCEPASLLIALAKYYPDTNFWIIGKSDFSKIWEDGVHPEFPNIKDAWNKKYWINGINPAIHTKDWPNNYDEHQKYCSYIVDVFKHHNIDIDYALLLSGLVMNASIPRTVLTVTRGKGDADGYCGVLESAYKYSSHIYYFLNVTNIKYDIVCTDPRQYRCYARELNNLPQKVLSQATDLWIDKGRYVCWPAGVVTSTQRDIYTEYGYSELINLLSKKPNEDLYNLNEEYFKNKSGYNIIMNEGHPGTAQKGFKDSPRYIELNKYILKQKDFSCNIYGKWPDDIINSDDRFKGPIQPINMGDILHKTKYTYCIPIKDKWVTSKFIEMASFGVIPFLHPSYGRDVKECKYLMKFFYVKSFEEMQEKVSALEADFSLYMKIIKLLRDILFANGSYQLYNGEFISKYYNKIRPEYFNNIIEPDKNNFIIDILENIPQKNELQNRNINSLSTFF